MEMIRGISERTACICWVHFDSNVLTCSIPFCHDDPQLNNSLEQDEPRVSPGYLFGCSRGNELDIVSVFRLILLDLQFYKIHRFFDWRAHVASTDVKWSSIHNPHFLWFIIGCVQFAILYSGGSWWSRARFAHHILLVISIHIRHVISLFLTKFMDSMAICQFCFMGSIYNFP